MPQLFSLDGAISISFQRVSSEGQAASAVIRDLALACLVPYFFRTKRT